MFKKKQWVLSVCVLISTLTFSQPTNAINKSNWSLLWEITGNGLTKPSYLFGTVHVMDKRAFEFPDSLYHAIQQSEVLALEMQLDSAMTFLLEEIFGKVMKGLPSKLDRSTDFYDDIDFSKLESTKSFSPPVDKETIVDAYLARIARQQGKNTIGLESFEDHIKIPEDLYKVMVEELVQYNDDSTAYENLIRTYRVGSLEGIDSLSQHYTQKFRAAVLLNRNRLMVDKMMQLMSVQPLFCGVGAAHLPGKGGMLDLLKGAGYTVRRVMPTFTGLAESYKEQPQNHTWSVFSDALLGLRFEMPHEPVTFSMFEGMQNHVWLDQATGVFYFTFVMDMPPFFDLLQQNIYDDLLKTINMTEEGGIGEIKNITSSQGHQGVEMMMKNDEDKSFDEGRMHIYILNNKVYLFMVGSYLKTQLESYAAKRFFESLHFEARDFSTMVQSEIGEGQTYRDKKGAFQMPAIGTVHFQKKQRLGQASFFTKTVERDIHYYSMKHPTKDIDYRVGYWTKNKKNVRGLFSLDNEQVENPFEDILGDTALTTQAIALGTWSGKEYLYQLTKTVCLKAQVFQRGQREYAVVAKYLNQDTATVQTFFDGFQFLPYSEAPFINYIASEDSFSIALPCVPKSQKRKKYLAFLNDRKNYTAISEYTGSVYEVEIKKLSKYLYMDSLKHYYDDLVERVVGYEDTVLLDEWRTVGDTKGRYVMIHPQGGDDIETYLFLVYGDKLFTLKSFHTTDYEPSVEHQKFFTSLKIHQSKTPFDITIPKQAILLNDILNGDKKTFRTAIRNIDDFDFEVTDIPMIKAILLKKNKYARNEDYKKDLLHALGQLEDETILSFYKSLYLKDSLSSELQLVILQNIGTNYEHHAFFELLKQHFPENITYEDFKKVTRSFFYNKKAGLDYYDQWTAYMTADNFMSYEFFRFTATLLKKEGFKKDKFKPLEEEFIIAFLKQAAKLQRYDAPLNVLLDNPHVQVDLEVLEYLTEIMQYVAMPKEVFPVLQELSKLKETALQIIAIRTLMMHGQMVNTDIWEVLLQDDEKSFEFLKRLDKKQLLHAVPAQYLDQAVVARRALIFELKLHGETYYDRIKFVREIEIPFKGTLVRLYIYQICGYELGKPEGTDADTVDRCYLGISGPQPIDRSQVNFSNELMEYLERPFDENRIEEMVETHVKQVSKGGR